MEIIDKRVPLTISISLLDKGDCFYLDGNYYIKTDSFITTIEGFIKFDCVNLENGNTISLPCDYQCTPVNTKLFIFAEDNE